MENMIQDLLDIEVVMLYLEVFAPFHAPWTPLEDRSIDIIVLKDPHVLSYRNDTINWSAVHRLACPMSGGQVTVELVNSLGPYRWTCLRPSSLALYYQELVCIVRIFSIMKGMKIGVSFVSWLRGVFILGACDIPVADWELNV